MTTDAARDVSIPLRAIVESIAAQMGMDRGRWRVEFRFDGGVLIDCDRHDERIPADQLDKSEPRTGRLLSF